MSSWYAAGGKRVFDVAVATFVLVLSSPLLAGVSLLVWVTQGRPVLFSQVRPGLAEKPFRMFKFRTMRNAVDALGHPLPDEQRITRVGALLRKASLDELPELFNVLGGSMSLVGPRPLLMRYLPYFRREERARFSVRPGITGLAQVEGRNHLSWDARLALDVRYVATLSAASDLRILARTARQVVCATGVAVLPTGRMQDLDVERRTGLEGPHGS